MMRSLSPWLITGTQEALEACLGAGMSAEQTARTINRTFNTSMSRMAVIGRARRTEVPFLSKTAEKDVKIPPTPRGIRGGRPKSFVVAAVEVRKLREEPKPLGVDTACQWLHGEPAKRRFCGHARKPGSTSYCEHHHARAFDTARTAHANAAARGRSLREDAAA